MGSCSAQQPRPTVASPTPTLVSASSRAPTPTAAPSESPTEGLLPTPPVVDEEDLALTCGSPLRFGADALQGPVGVESADHPLAASLRGLIADSPLPKRDGWQLAVLTPDQALFLLPANEAEGSGYWNAEFQLADSSWRYVRSGQCDMTPTFAGAEPARWELSPGSTPTPETRRLQLRVFEQACSSGRSPEGRVGPAAVVYRDDALIVIIATRPLPGAQTCEPGPPVDIEFDLAEPLGDRALLNGATLPAELIYEPP